MGEGGRRPGEEKKSSEQYEQNPNRRVPTNHKPQTITLCNMKHDNLANTQNADHPPL
jgi:hypothetical protein